MAFVTTDPATGKKVVIQFDGSQSPEEPSSPSTQSDSAPKIGTPANPGEIHEDTNRGITTKRSISSGSETIVTPARTITVPVSDPTNPNDPGTRI